MAIKCKPSLISTNYKRNGNISTQEHQDPENNTHFKLTHPWGAWLMSILLCYRSTNPPPLLCNYCSSFWLKMRCACSSYFVTTVVLSGWRRRVHIQVRSQIKDNTEPSNCKSESHQSEVLTASSTSMHRCVPGSALFSSPFFFCISVYRALRFLYASLQFLHTSE